MTPSTLRSPSVFAWLLAATPFFAADAPPAIPESDLIVLPKYEVTTERVLPPMKKWKYVSVPGYEVLSDASDTNTKRFISDFHLLRQVAAQILPEAKIDPSIPTYIVLCSKGNDFEHFIPDSEKDSRGQHSGSTFFDDGERSAIVVDYTFEDSFGSSEQVDPYRGFYIQYFRQLVRKSFGNQLPAWMEEGLVQIYAAVEFSDQGISLGKLEDARADEQNTRQARRAPPTSAAAAQSGRAATGYASSDDPASVGVNSNNLTGVTSEYITKTSATTAIATGSFNKALAENRIIPLSDFFAVTSLKLSEFSKLGGSYPAQAYLFSHMCLYGRAHRYQKAYYKLAARAAKGPITEEIFKECFGMDYKKMEVEMRGYVEFTDYERIDYRFKKGQKFETAPAITLREASDAESGRIAGEVMRMGGHQEEALTRLIAPYVRGERDAELLAALGLAEKKAGHSERAQKFLEAAIAGKTTRALAYLELARLRAGEIQTKAQVEKRAVKAGDLKPIEEALLAGAKCPPPMYELYDMLARLWHDSHAKPTLDQFNHLMPGALKFSTRLGLVYRIAAIGVDCGYFEKSRLLIQHGLEVAPNESVKKEFAALAEKLPPATTAKK
ncbi:MAG: hypothetical protein QM715_14565 [Nibricoccus sp.]